MPILSWSTVHADHRPAERQGDMGWGVLGRKGQVGGRPGGGGQWILRNSTQGYQMTGNPQTSPEMGLLNHGSIQGPHCLCIEGGWGYSALLVAAPVVTKLVVCHRFASGAATCPWPGCARSRHSASTWLHTLKEALLPAGAAQISWLVAVGTFGCPTGRACRHWGSR